jgi:hypothetical protein
MSPVRRDGDSLRRRNKSRMEYPRSGLQSNGSNPCNPASEMPRLVPEHDGRVSCQDLTRKLPHDQASNEPHNDTRIRRICPTAASVAFQEYGSPVSGLGQGFPVRRRPPRITRSHPVPQNRYAVNCLVCVCRRTQERLELNRRQKAVLFA